LQVSQIAKFLPILQIIHRQDVVDAARIQAFDDVAADKPSGACDNDFHNFS
jgi:hypothetical protein